MIIGKIIEKLNIISGVSNSHSENWTFLTFEGIYNDRYSKTYFSDLCDAFKEENLEDALALYVGNDKMCLSDFLEEIDNGSKWKIHINKISWLDKFNDICHTFFYYEDEFIAWVSKSNPFEEDYPLNKGSYHIYVNGIESEFGGPNFIVNGSDIISGCFKKDSIPDYQIENTIRINCNSDFIISPHKHIINKGKVNHVSKFFYRNAIWVLLASLCDEVTKEREVVIRGYRKVVTGIGGDILIDDNLFVYHNLLLEIVEWIYEKEDSRAIKKRLFAERVSLDINQSLNMFDSLYPILLNVYSQIKEQYSYVMYDRKDAYQKELKDLLKDVKNVTDLFSNKIRNILGNLLRDVLAALILVGITLFSKVSEVSALFDNNLINYVFKAFGLYFCCSVILQVIFDCLDVYSTIGEFDYWKNISRSYISKSQFNEYKKQTICKRFKQMIWYYVFIVLLYLGIGYFCYNFQSIWKAVLFPTNEESVENIYDSSKLIPDSTNVLMEESNDTII